MDNNQAVSQGTCETIMETFSVVQHVSLTTVLIMIIMFGIFDETQWHHEKDMICTKTVGIGAVITYNYRSINIMVQ